MEVSPRNPRTWGPAFRRQWGAFTPSCVALTLGWPLLALATELQGSVTLAMTPVPQSKIASALDLCAEHERHLSPGECVNTFWVPRWLLDQEAQSLRLAEQPQMRAEIADLLHRNLVRQFPEPGRKISKHEVDAYLQKNDRDYHKPLRLRLFRILVASRTEAEKLRAGLGNDTSIDDFRKLARDKSLDQATHERGGDLGFVWPDGSTDVPQVRVEISLYQAALKLEDGEIASEIVPEGERFAILWRRGSKAEEALNEESRRVARLRLEEQRREEDLQRLLTRLSTEKVKERNDTLLGKLRRKEASLFREP